MLGALGAETLVPQVRSGNHQSHLLMKESSTFFTEKKFSHHHWPPEEQCFLAYQYNSD
jgi:hypothetical protein